MMTVRFASGFSIQYNTANYCTRSQNYSDLFTTKDGVWIAQVPNDVAVIESVHACRTYIAQDGYANTELARIANELRLLKRTIAKQQKKATK